MATKRKAEDEPEEEKHHPAKKQLVKKLISFVEDAIKKHNKILLKDAKNLWALASDGPGVTQNEFATLEHILGDEDIDMTEAARLHLHYLVTRQESGKSLYKTIDGVKYDRSCLDLAEHLFKDGKIDVGDAKQMWEEVEDGPGVTEIEKRTIEKVMADKADHITAGAVKFLRAKLDAWVNPSTGTASPKLAPSSPKSTTSPKVAASPKSPKVAASPKKTASPAAVAPAVVPEKAVEAKEAKAIESGERIELIVDCSGSMRPLLDATVLGLNSFIKQQQAETGAEKRHVRITTFNSSVFQPSEFHCSLPSVPEVTQKLVMPSGQTALLDAIGTVLSSVPVDHPSVVVIVTDGMENQSKKFTQAQINALIAERTEWTFVFLAANQNAITTGEKFGLPAGSCATFAAAVDGVVGAFQAVHQLTSRSWKTTSQEERSFTTNERFAMNK